MKMEIECAICGDKADGQHFGANSCRACAAFFRRTVAGKMKYICRFDNNCEINKTLRCMCRSCRLTKCANVGMNPQAVQASRTPIHAPYHNNHRRSTASSSPGTTEQPEFAVTKFPSSPQPAAHRQILSTATGSTTTTTTPPLRPIHTITVIQPMPDKPTVSRYSVESMSSATTPSLSSSVSPTEFTAYGRGDENVFFSAVTTNPSTSLHDHVVINSLISTSHVEQPCNSNADNGMSEPMTEDSKPAIGSTDHPTMDASKPNDLRTIIENSIATYAIDESTLPPSYPVLMTMDVAYHDFLARRNRFYRRRSFTNGSRTFVQKTTFKIIDFVQQNRNEVEWIADMLSNFHGYCDISLEDKIVLFKHFWIHFVILERTFDAFFLLDGAIDDNRMILQNGDVYDVETMEYDCTGICDAREEKKIREVCYPWIKNAGCTLLPPMKDLRPIDIEIMFAFGFMLWNVKDFASQLSPHTIAVANRMTTVLYDELFAYYNLNMPQENFVRRIGEVMRLVSLTNTIASHRKEDILITSMFKIFNVDVFLNGLFEFVHT